MMDRAELIKLHIDLLQNNDNTDYEKTVKLLKDIGAYTGKSDIKAEVFSYYDKKDDKELHRKFHDLSSDIVDMCGEKRKRLGDIFLGLLLDPISIVGLMAFLFKTRYFFTIGMTGSQYFALALITMLVILEVKWIKEFFDTRKSFKYITAIESLHMGMILLAMTVHKCTEAGKDLKPDMLEGFLENEFHNEYETFTAVTSRV